LAPVTQIIEKPVTLEHLKAAAVPVPGLTAWQALFDTGVLRRRPKSLDSWSRGRGGQLRGSVLQNGRGLMSLARVGLQRRLCSDLGVESIRGITSAPARDVAQDVDGGLRHHRWRTQKQS